MLCIYVVGAACMSDLGKITDYTGRQASRGIVCMYEYDIDYVRY